MSQIKENDPTLQKFLCHPVMIYETEKLRI